MSGTLDDKGTTGRTLDEIGFGPAPMVHGCIGIFVILSLL